MPGGASPAEPPSRLDSVVRAALPLTMLVALFGLLVEHASGPLTNFDTYFHLRFGHEFLTAWSPWAPGSVSSFATRDWLPTQWGSEIVMAKFEDWFGLAGVAWLAGTATLGYALAVFLACRSQGALVAAVPVTMLAMYGSTPGLSARPQVASYVLIAVTLAAWLRTAADGRPRWWLIPLTWVWVLLHGMWPVGIVIGLVAAVGSLLDRTVSRRRGWQLLAVPLGSALAAAATPIGPGIYGAVFLVGSRAHYFYEWAPPDFTRPVPFVVAAMIGTTVLLRLRRGQDSWVMDLLLLMAAGWAIYSLRTIPVAAAIVAPLLVRQLQRLPIPDRPATRVERSVVVAGFLAAVLGLALLLRAGQGVSPSEPAWMNGALGRLPADTRVLTEITFGGYLVWKYPQLDVSEHGYADTYTTREIDRIRAMDELKPGWDRRIAAMRAQYAVLPADSPIGHALVQFEGWHVLHRSPDVEMLGAP